jgi:salicylate hydroxylase
VPTEQLVAAFKKFADTQEPRTAALVKGARKQGETRVNLGGPEACELRDQQIATHWADEGVIVAEYEDICLEPFDLKAVA